MEVAPAGRDGWKVTRERQRIARTRTKAQAVAEAVHYCRLLAVNGGLLTLKIKGRDGRIREERTYPRSSDPRRTRG